MPTRLLAVAVGLLQYQRMEVDIDLQGYRWSFCAFWMHSPQVQCSVCGRPFAGSRWRDDSVHTLESDSLREQGQWQPQHWQAPGDERGDFAKAVLRLVIYLIQEPSERSHNG